MFNAFGLGVQMQPSMKRHPPPARSAWCTAARMDRGRFQGSELRLKGDRVEVSSLGFRSVVLNP